MQKLDDALRIENEISSAAFATKDYQDNATDFISTKEFSKHLQDNRI